MAPNPDIEKSTPVTSQPATTATPSISDNAEPGDVVDEDGDDEDEDDPPDGGLVAWTQVLAGNLVNCISWGYPATFGVYQLYYKDSLQLPQAEVSWIGSIQLFLTFLSCTFSGRLADAGYVKQTLAVGGFMVVFGTFMTSIATRYWEIFLAQGVCTGLGLGMMFMPPLTVINSYFKRKRAFALAIAATGTGIGSVIFPATIQYLIPLIGFPWAVRCSALVALFICTVATLVLKPRLKPRKKGPLVEWSAFREPPYVLFIMGSFLIFWPLYFGFFYVSLPCFHTSQDKSPPCLAQLGHLLWSTHCPH
jgi:MFS family permease